MKWMICTQADAPTFGDAPAFGDSNSETQTQERKQLFKGRDATTKWGEEVQGTEERHVVIKN